MFSMLGVFAEFERAILRERVFAGLARAKAQGKKLGRPQVSAEKAEAIRLAKVSVALPESWGSASAPSAAWPVRAET
jgi:DNA invertase Pin-like site-specific DNA recombinase